MTLVGGIEAGGTKFVCGVGDTSGGSRETATIPTRTPDETFAEVARFFAGATARHGATAAVGVASFGPIELDPAAPAFGRILRTPKPGWEGVDLRARVAAFARGPLGLDTDVNAAALAEAEAMGVDNLAYVTVGTGIGVGLVSGGETVRGLSHPEMGHVLVRRHPDHGTFAGVCPFHGDCLEGLASGPAIAAAWGCSLAELDPTGPAFAVEADYLAQLAMTLFLALAPQRVVMGGGVLKQEALLPMIRSRTAERLAGYFAPASGADDFEALIVPPASAEPPGLLGAYLLAERCLRP